jgi:hypothetical protein
MFSELFASIRRRLVQLWTPQRLTPSDIRTAYIVAVAIDAAQFVLGPLGWVGVDEVLDAVAMYAISRLVGFHPLLLPTFALEFVPFTDMLPTWTGCVALVVRIRRKQGLISDDAADSTPVIDVKAKRVE